MNDWHGIKVVRSQSNGRMNCSISFPPNFGVTEEEKNLLIHMVAHSAEVRSQTDCWISPDDVYQALNQLLRLVVEKQDAAAANLLLYSGTAEAPFNLDGEVSESYTEVYLIPTLEKYEKLDMVLDNARGSVIAKNICADLQWRKDIKDTRFKNRIKALAEKLNAKRMEGLARQIQACR